MLLLLLAPALAWMMGKVGKRYRRLNHVRSRESAADMLQTADRPLHAQQDVKAYGAQPAELARYGVQTTQNLRLALKIEVTRGTLSMLVQGLGAVRLDGVPMLVAGIEAAKRPAHRRRFRDPDDRDGQPGADAAPAHQRAEHAAAGASARRPPVLGDGRAERTRPGHARPLCNARRA